MVSVLNKENVKEGKSSEMRDSQSTFLTLLHFTSLQVKGITPD